ncbi:hypothetical protein CXG81DRAFT_16803 [Caulochytrium protostelioides]|uniref:AB hydrolase-1 domain-containing protein n=1 Tax=Caulochytrium protostelioides TaxID=1555241 RepID=A0A4P9XDW8_9FUNG|nr:hypothetical protein CXG81DRAFT_16803 [Caulochytrium protostelioides]|eukprot:RKP03705.1 hypothetical protein CXG81DRAFT_16803 [Caulochytrium protostelioides]
MSSPSVSELPAQIRAPAPAWAPAPATAVRPPLVFARPRFTNTIIQGQEGTRFRLSVNVYRNPDPQALRIANTVVLMAHANGLHKELWEPLINQAWTARNQGRSGGAPHIAAFIAWDVRCQGDSAPLNPASSEDPDRWSWVDIAQDGLAVWQWVQQVVPAAQRRFVLGVGHSMGANSLLQMSMMKPQLFRHLYLYEPCGPVWGDSEEDLATRPLEDFSMSVAAARRHCWYPSRDAAYTMLRRKPFFRNWTDLHFSLWLEYGLRPGVNRNGEPGFVTKTTPNDEAKTFLGVGPYNMLDQLRTSFATPSTVWAGSESFFCKMGSVNTDPKIRNTIHFIAAQMERSTVVDLEDASHMLPFEHMGYDPCTTYFLDHSSKIAWAPKL